MQDDAQIIGAGISGNHRGLLLAKAGLRVTVYESRNYWLETAMTT